MGHSAFELFTLVADLPVKIESLAVWGNTLFVGTQEGSLLVYTITYTKTAEKAKRFTHTLSQSLTKKQFSKKAITQLCTIPELGVLVSLSDGIIRLHTLATLKEISTLQKQGSPMKGCTTFALKKEKGEFSLIVAFNKKNLSLLSYDYKETTFKFVQDLYLPDVAQSVNWSGKSICVGFKREYVLINPDVVTPKSLFNTGSLQNTTVGLTLGDEMILTRDNFCLSFNFEGKPTRFHGISFSENPNALAFLLPYLISPLSMFVEVRLISNVTKKETLVQTFAISGVTKLSQPNFVDLDDGFIDEGRGVGFKVKGDKIDTEDDIIPDFRLFLASKSNIYVMCMKPIYMQANQLQRKREFDQALSLCEIYEGSPYEVEKWRVTGIHLDYGFDLFIRGQFENAMEHFSKTEHDPRIIISLYPDLLSKGSVFAQSALPIMEEQEKVEKLFADHEQKISAMNALIPFLTCRRVPVTKEVTGDAAAIAEAVDTALLKAMLVTNDEFLISFIESPNRCNVSEAERILMKRYNELILFYKKKDLHDRALVLLKRLGDPKGEEICKELEGVRPTIKYLQELCSALSQMTPLQQQQIQHLIMEHSRWVLQTAPIVGLKIFTHQHNPFSISEVLNYLESIGSKVISMKIAFLEHLIQNEKLTEPELHNTLVILYKDYLLLPENLMQKEEFRYEEISSKLKAFLSGSKYYNPEKMLSRWPFDRLYEERAILLSRINRHSQALNIYITSLKRIDLAEKYCEQHYNTSNEESREIFLTLLSTHLQQASTNPAAAEQTLRDAIGLLERHYDKIDSIKALKIIPSNMPISSVQKYLEAVMRKYTETRRNIQVMRNLARSENLVESEKWINERKRFIKIKIGKICPVCKKKIGMSAFAAYPNGTVTHYACAKDVQVDPITNKNFYKDYLPPPSFEMAPLPVASFLAPASSGTAAPPAGTSTTSM